MAIITDESEQLKNLGFAWREVNGIKALVCTSLESEGFANAFSTRIGGVSRFPQDDLNLAGFDDDRAENIHENRRRFLKLFEGEWTIATQWQIHSPDVCLVKDAEDARANRDKQKCDAMVSNASNVLLGVKTADCVPILLGDTKTRSFAAVHAGWRGTVESIVVNAVRRMRKEFGTRPEDIRAAIGPAASGKCYEVGTSVIHAFHSNFPNAKAIFTPTQKGHAYIDLHRANRNQLISVGVDSEKIHIAPFCTMTRTDLFFSYRVEQKLYGKTGRLLSVIGVRSAECGVRS
jgi:hypothetical protein